MNKSSRFAVAVHIMSGLALGRITGMEECVTSSKLATSVNTNPVVVRRILGVMRNAGLVTSIQGADGGSTLSRPPEQITLLDIYRAVETGQLFHFHYAKPNAECPIGCCILEIMQRVVDKADAAVSSVLANYTLRDIAEELRERGRQRWAFLNN